MQTMASRGLMRKGCNCIWTYVTFTWFWFSFLLVEVEFFIAQRRIVVNVFNMK